MVRYLGLEQWYTADAPLASERRSATSVCGTSHTPLMTPPPRPLDPTGPLLLQADQGILDMRESKGFFGRLGDEKGGKRS